MTRWFVLALALWLVACSDSSDWPAPADTDPPSWITEMAFAGVNAEGAATELSLTEYHHPHSDGVLLVMVSGGLWCGTCQWLLHDDEPLYGARPHDRVQRLDLVIGDRDNAPANDRAARAWWERIEGRRRAVAADPGYRLEALLDAPSSLPLMVLFDTNDMAVIDVRANPSPHEVKVRVAAALANTEALLHDEPLVADGYRSHEWALLQQTRLPSTPPANPSNAVSDSPAAAALGELLFFDAGLSPSGTVSCASCHKPEHSFADTLPVAVGVAAGTRRTPRIALAAHARWQTWSGRADSLWAQALDPFESPVEYDSSRTFVARRVLASHRDAYRDAFPSETLPSVALWPVHGKPGDPAYDALPVAEQDAITTVFVNVGKAIEAFERSWRVAPNPLDAYLGGDVEALDAEQTYGLQVFVSSGCMQCHWGPRLSDDAFHNIGQPGDDRGRSDGLNAWLASDFARSGRWSDSPGAAHTADATPSEHLLGQFKTPPLRGLANAAFLGHGGNYHHLSELMEHYGYGDVQPTVGTREPWLPSFGETAQWGLLPFLEVLTADVVGIDIARD